ncbi:MAG: hypothetical protein AB7K52_00025 [Phycisphaerales bacterium]
MNPTHTVPGAVTDDARTLDTVVYDAWNRLITVQGRGSGKITAMCRYDGLGWPHCPAVRRRNVRL